MIEFNSYSNYICVQVSFSFSNYIILNIVAVPRVVVQPRYLTTFLKIFIKVLFFLESFVLYIHYRVENFLKEPFILHSKNKVSLH